METTAPALPAKTDVLTPLLAVQAAVLLVATFEALVFTMAFGSLSPVVGFTALAFLLIAAGLGRSMSRRRLLWLRRLQRLFLATALIDLGLAIFMAQRLLEPVSLLTRLALPLYITRTLTGRLREDS